MTQRDDLISRQDAIDALRKHEINLPIFTPRETDVFWDDAIDCCVSVLERLPSAQPETHEKRTETHECDYISRQDAIMHFVKASKSYECGMFNLKELTHELWQLPSAQLNLDEWCTDCKEYDQEHHSCPRWNRVIRQTVEDLMTERRTDG